MLDTEQFSPIELFPGESDDHLWDLTVAAFSDQNPGPGAAFIPPGLDDMPPGPYLAAILSSIDLSRLTGEDVVRVLRAHHRQVSHHQAAEYSAMAEVAHCVANDSAERWRIIDEYAPDEVGAALTYTRRKADYEVGIALDLRYRLPEVQAALKSGVIDSRKAAMLSRETRHLDETQARSVALRVLEAAPRLTTGQLRARIARLCMETDPESAKERMEYSLSRRALVAEPNGEGTAVLIISECSPDEVYAARDHVNTLARRLKTADEPRTMDQLRADVALALLSGRMEQARGSGGSVAIQVDLTTLAQLDESPGELAGYGPIVAEIARKVAADQTRSDWTAAVTDPETGELLRVVSVRRRPTARQTRAIVALHPTCTFPGCRMPATECDIDHIVEYAGGGSTIVSNQTPLCRHHHMAKHNRGWRYRKIGRTEIEWLSPLGHYYRTKHPP